MRQGKVLVGVAVMGLLASSLGCCFSGLQPVRGSGPLKEKVYAVDGFHGVALSNQGNLTIAYGEEERLVVEAEANLLPYLEARVEDGILHIRTRPGVWIWPSRSIEYQLTVTELDAVSVTGSGDAVGPVLEGEEVSVRVTGSGDVTLDGIDAADSVDILVTGSGGAWVAADNASGGSVTGSRAGVTVTGSGGIRVTSDDPDGASIKGNRAGVTVTGSGNARVDGDDADGASVLAKRVSLQAKRVSLAITGSGGVRLGEMEADELDVRITGSGDLTVAGGRVRYQTISTSGSGTYRARGLESATAQARVSGSGAVTIQVEDELEARLTGSGDVRYAGSPAVDADTTGSGDVVRAGD
jgi:hypothetical protein